MTNNMRCFVLNNKKEALVLLLLDLINPIIFPIILLKTTKFTEHHPKGLRQEFSAKSPPNYLLTSSNSYRRRYQFRFQFFISFPSFTEKFVINIDDHHIFSWLVQFKFINCIAVVVWPCYSKNKVSLFMCTMGGTRVKFLKGILIFSLWRFIWNAGSDFMCASL